MGIKLEGLPTFQHPLGFKVIETQRNCISVYLTLNERHKEQWFLLSSDRHHDNMYADWEFERKHLEEAKKRKAGIIDIGDLFCAMQGKYDPRSDRSQIRPEHNVNNYLNALVDTAHSFYQPYADNILLLGKGNHETGVLKRNNFDLTQSLVDKLRPSNPAVRLGYYSGWVMFKTTIYTRRKRLNLHYHHGYGGGGPVTRGVIQTNRMAVYLPDADIVHTGHTHDQWSVSIQRARITKDGKSYSDRQLHVRTSGYKDDYADGAEGWHIERGGPPKPKSAAWLRIYYGGDKRGVEFEIQEAA